MFEPKIYKKNGLEAFRLAGSDGSEFFYEGAIDCDEKELYKDALGRLYYPVIAEIGGQVKYYVELDPQVPQIPVTGQGSRENSISRLVNASPRSDTPLPEEIFVNPEVPQETYQETPQEVPQEAPQELAPEATHEVPPVMPPETVPAEPALSAEVPEPKAEMPEPAPVEHMKSEEAASAIQAVFSPRVDLLHPPAEPAEKAAEPETKKKKKVSPAVAPEKVPAKAAKKRSLKWPVTIAVIVIVLIAASAVGVYVVKPGAYDGLRSMLTGQSPTPVPTAAPIETPTPSPVPTTMPDEGIPSASISDLIDCDNPLVAAFARANINATSDGDPLRVICDLFSQVNGQWKYSDSYMTPRMASEIAGTLEGTSRDYTVLMIALMQTQGIECRVVFSYPDGSNIPYYYPEILAANTSAGYQEAVQQLQQWYGMASLQGHSDDTGYWVALSMGDFPGIRPSGTVTEYALYRGIISPLR